MSDIKEQALKYKISKKDHYKAYLLHIKPRKIYATLGIGMIFLVLLTSYLTYKNKVAGWTPFIIIGSLICVLFGVYIYPIYSINKILKQTKWNTDEINISLEKESFKISTEKSNNTIPYGEIFKLKSNKHYLLIYINQYTYIILPKENSELQESAKCIEENFAKKI